MRIRALVGNAAVEGASIDLLQIVADGQMNESNENRKREENFATSCSERQHQL